MGEEEIWAGRSWEATWQDNKPHAPPLHVKLWWPATNSLLTPLTVLAAGVGIKKLCLYVNKNSISLPSGLCLQSYCLWAAVGGIPLVWVQNDAVGFH